MQVTGNREGKRTAGQGGGGGVEPKDEVVVGCLVGLGIAFILLDLRVCPPPPPLLPSHFPPSLPPTCFPV